MDRKQKYWLKAKIWIESKRTDWKQKYESKAKIEMKSNNIMDVKQKYNGCKAKMLIKSKIVYIAVEYNVVDVNVSNS